MTRGRKGGLIAAALLALSCSGCSSAWVKLTAPGSLNPVMFGPVRTVGAAAVAVAPAPTGGTSFDYRQKMQIWLLAGIAGSGSLTVYTTGTDNDWLSKSLGSWPVRSEFYDRPGLLDWKVRQVTAEDAAMRVDLTSLRCGGFASFFLAGFASGSGCEIEGLVSRPQ